MSRSTSRAPPRGAEVRQIVVLIAVYQSKRIIVRPPTGFARGWTHPGGRIIYGETRREAAVRKALDELELEIEESRLCRSGAFRRDLGSYIHDVYIFRFTLTDEEAANLPLRSASGHEIRLEFETRLSELMQPEDLYP